MVDPERSGIGRFYSKLHNSRDVMIKRLLLIKSIDDSIQAERINAINCSMRTAAEMLGKTNHITTVKDLLQSISDGKSRTEADHIKPHRAGFGVIGQGTLRACAGRLP